jgi:O-acetyl-ADP-ribose deacetylase (regulator of RNase III)
VSGAAVDVARDRALRSAALPSISTGAFGYPIARASVVAMQEIEQFPGVGALPSVTVVCFDADVHRPYEAAST